MMVRFERVSALQCCAASIAIALSMVASAAQAQDVPPPPAAAVQPDAEIIVTGSRIARPQLTAPVPVAVVSASDIQNKGYTNVLDAFRDLPIVGQSDARTASNFSNYDNGTATVNLRNLGDARTLVLINGRRSIGLPGSTAVDLNNIPTDLIDHTEIVTGGTSAVYGSDAVAGVVNIILKKKFDGLQLHAQNMISSRGDAASRFVSATAGTSFGDGRGNILGNFTYSQDDALASSARDYSRLDSPSGSAYSASGLYDTSGEASYTVADQQTYTLDRNNQVKLYQGLPSDRYNRASDRLLATPVKRYQAMVLGNFAFSDAADFYFEASYVKTKARGQIEPLAVDDQGVQGQSVYNFDGTPFSGISVNNAFLPAQIANAAIANGQSTINFRRRSNGIFDRSPVSDRDYWRGVIGLRGDIGSGWKYDVSYEHSQVRDDTVSGAIMMTNYGAALNTALVGGKIVCADPVARAAGCVPINIFGYNTVTPEAAKWLGTYTGQGAIVPGASPGEMVTDNFLRKSWQDVATASITGSLFSLPGGPVGIAAGVEYHSERADEYYDPFTISGLSSAQQAGNTVGKYHSKEAFAEVNIPLFSDRPFVHELSLQGAVRYADYSTVGSVWSYKYGGTYAPSRDIRFRAIYARAVRAPNINELYQSPASTAPQVTDPCDQNQGKGDIPVGGSPALATLPKGRAAVPGISNYLTTHPYFAYSLAQIQTIVGFLGGNPKLQAEATNTFTAGMTLTPRFLPNFFLTADYYSVKVKNAVAAVDQQVSVDQCFLTGAPEFCNSVTRNSNGFITQVDALNVNAASYLVSGIDVQAGYSVRTHWLAKDEKWTLGVFYNHKFKQEQTPFLGGAVVNELGTADTYAGNQLGTGFKDQFTLSANYQGGPVAVAYKLRWMGPVSASSGSYHIPAYSYHDIQVKFTAGERRQLEFYLGVNNVFDKQPPFIAAGNSQWPGTNTVADTYDLFGRMLYAGVTTRF